MQIPPAGRKYDQSDENQARALISLELDQLDSRVTVLEAGGGGNGSNPNTSPSASFTRSAAGRVLTFTDTSTDAAGTIVGWNWTFGDGQTATTRNPQHTYAADGNYLVTLRVTNNSGVADTETQTVPVSGSSGGNAPPVANFTTSRTARTVTFTNTSTDADGTVASNAWTFGDGSSSTLRNPTHTYAADGTYSVSLTATDDDGATNVKTAFVSVFTAVGSGGKAFGIAGGFSSNTALDTGVDSFNLIHDSCGPGNISSLITTARAAGRRLLLNMTGGAHANNYAPGGSSFDLPTWKLRMDAYNTSTLRATINAAIADGTILGNSVIDEPNHSTWGGTVNKNVVDQMCTYVKGIFTSMAVGVVSRSDWLASTHYTVCDFVLTQYSYRLGTHAAFRTESNALAAADGVKIVFGLNLNGGPQISGCPCCTQTGGVPPEPGSGNNNCLMTPTQITDTITALGDSGVAFRMYTRGGVGGSATQAAYDAIFANTAYQNAFASGAQFMATTTATSWYRG